MKFSTASANLFIFVASILSLSTASGQTAPAGRFPEPLEKYEMQPAPLIYRLETSPRMISQYGPFISYQVNVDAQGNNIVGDAANEPSISVDPTDGNKVAIGWRQFDTCQSNFRQSGYGYTTDAGVTWHFPGVLENQVFRSDPVTNSDDTGTFFYLSLLVNNFCGDIWRSTTADKRGRSVHRTAGLTAAIRNGSLSTGRPPAWVTASNISFGPKSSLASSEDSVARPMAEQRGRVRSVFPTLLSGEHSTWPPMETFSSAAGIQEAVFGAFGRPTHRTRLLRRLLTRSQQSTWAAAWFSAPRVNPGGLAGQIFIAVDRSGGATNNNIYMVASVLADWLRATART